MENSVLDDIINRGKIGLEILRFLVLDEADKMLNMGFEFVTLLSIAICRQLVAGKPVPKNIQELACDFLQNSNLHLRILRRLFCGLINMKNAHICWNYCHDCVKEILITRPKV